MFYCYHSVHRFGDELTERITAYTLWALFRRQRSAVYPLDDAFDVSHR
jgi:hypothetical protein